MAVWTVAAIATTIFMSIYDSQDFRERLNMKIAPTFEYKRNLVIAMFVNFIFCYVWEVSIKSIFFNSSTYVIHILRNAIFS